MAAGGPKPSMQYVERQALTRLPATPAAPTGLTSNSAAFGGPASPPPLGTTTPGDGIVLAGLMALVVSVFPNPGQTLSGAGSLLCWIYNPFAAAWARCSDLDLDVSDASGFPAKTFAAFSNVSRLGMLANWLTSAVTVSGGTDVLVRIDGFTSVGSQAI
jgi:hypothetical protein